MRYFWDIESGNLVTSLGDRTPVTEFVFKRGDTRDDELIFVKNGAQYDPSATSIKFGVKLAGAVNYLVSTNLFNKTGTGSTAVWTFAPSFNTTELNTALNIGGVGAELASVNAELEFEYTVGSAIVSTKTFPCKIYRDINRGNEGTTTAANPSYPAPSEIELKDNKNSANGYAGLDGSGKIASAQLPSYVDDVLEYAGTAQLPSTGETGKIYVTLDANKTYRWSGSAYVEISPSPGSTDSVTEGTNNLYYTAARVRGVLLDGLSTATTAVISSTDSILVALGKLQSQITNAAGDVINSVLTGLSTATNSAVTATDSILAAIGKLQAQINSVLSTALTGLSTSNSVVTATDSILTAIGKLQGQITAVAGDVVNALLAGFSTASSAAVTASDSVVGGIGKLQAQINNILSTALTGFSTSTNSAVTSSDTIVGGVGKLQAQVNSLNTRTDSIGLAVSDETTALTTGNNKLTFRMPYALTLTDVRISVTTAPAGSTIIVDINRNGTSIFSTRVSIDATEKTSVTAATAYVLTTTALSSDDEITVDIDQVGSSTAGAGLKIWLIGTR